MRLTTKRRVERLEAITVDNSEFDDLIDYINSTVVTAHNKLGSDYQRLKRHLSTNGVLKSVRTLLDRVTRVEERLDALDTNGVATAINKLNKEVFGETKSTGSGMERVMASIAGLDLGVEPTLAAKVDAIIEHLGIEVTATPEKVVRTPAKVAAKKVKKTVKKGRK